MLGDENIARQLSKLLLKGIKLSLVVLKKARKAYKMTFFLQIIWSCKKKAVPLHPLSKRSTVR